MNISQYLEKVIQELNKTVDLIPELEAEKLLKNILESKKIFVAGAGRSGLMGDAYGN
jgi:6-phospho-3-hexuloisomerase